MTYERKAESNPEAFESYYGKELLGYTPTSNYPTSFDRVLRNVPTPPQQKHSTFVL